MQIQQRSHILCVCMYVYIPLKLSNKKKKNKHSIFKTMKKMCE